MPDAIEEAKTVAFTLETRSVYTRIGKDFYLFLPLKSNFLLLFSFNL
jgi:hypothetical protein